MRNFNEISRKNVTFDSIKSHKKPGFTLSLGITPSKRVYIVFWIEEWKDGFCAWVLQNKTNYANYNKIRSLNWVKKIDHS